MNETLDESKFLSLERAKRGAKIGAEFGLALTIAATPIAVLENPNLFYQTLSSPEQFLIAPTLIATYFGLIGAVTNGIRPVSRLFSREVDRMVNTAQSIKEGAAYAYNSYLNGQLSETISNILRPKLPEEILDNKTITITTSTLASGFAAGGLYTFCALEQKMDSALNLLIGSNHIDPIFSAIANNPSEVISAGVLVGFGISSYALLMHRRPAEFNEDDF